MPRPKYALFGQPMSAAQLAELAGSNVPAMHARLHTMSPEEAVTRPVRVLHEDLIGKPPYGRLTVERRAGTTRAGKPTWWCRCACGRPELVEVIGADLKSGRTTSCGCWRAEQAAARASERAEDLTGQRFADGTIEVLGPSDRWTTTKRGPAGEHRHRLWRCLCKPCGTTFEAKASSLRQGQVTSCGCGATWAARTKAAQRARAEKHPFRGESLTLPEIAARTGIERATLHYRMRHMGLSAENAATMQGRDSGQRGKPKICKACGEPGHNRLGCSKARERAA